MNTEATPDWVPGVDVGERMAAGGWTERDIAARTQWTRRKIRGTRERHNYPLMFFESNSRTRRDAGPGWM